VRAARIVSSSFYGNWTDKVGWQAWGSLTPHSPFRESPSHNSSALSTRSNLQFEYDFVQTSQFREHRIRVLRTSKICHRKKFAQLLTYEAKRTAEVTFKQNAGQSRSSEKIARFALLLSGGQTRAACKSISFHFSQTMLLTRAAI
jgi:hypothetical protein